MGELIAFFAKRIKDDNIGLQAAAMAYTCVLAMVPALTIVLSIFAVIPAFQQVKEELMTFASSNFLPVFTDAISGSITTFVSHATSMTVTGSLMLFVVSLMLIRSIDKTLNRIWRGGRRRIPITFAIYWTLLTVGPLSFGLIVWATTKLIASNIFEGMELNIAVSVIYFIMPFIIEAGMIFALYTIIPVAVVKFRDTFIGAIVVALCFEVLKRGFSAFILNFTDYEAIYGALAAAPVLMMWIYLNWWLILIGAEFTATVGFVRDGQIENPPKLLVKLVKLTTPKNRDLLKEQKKLSLLDIGSSIKELVERKEKFEQAQKENALKAQEEQRAESEAPASEKKES